MKRVVLVFAALIAGTVVSVSPTSAAGHAVEMRNNAFNPPDMTVAVGDTVVWHNYDAEIHSVVGGAINSPDVAPGGEFSWTFSGPAEITYTCRFHPYMTGVVRATSAGAPPTAAPAASPGPSSATTAPASSSPATSAAPSTNVTSPPPAAFMAVASDTPLRPELVADPTTTVVESVPATTAPMVATTVAEAAIGLAGSSSSTTGVWLLGGLVVVALAVFFGVRAVRKDITQ